MIIKYYQEADIRIESERRFSECVDLSLRYDPDNEWHILHSYKLGSHKFQKEGECDFVIISPFGIIVVECKGGVIRRNKGRFERKRSGSEIWEALENPFDQLDGNSGTLEGVLRKKKVRGTFISSFVYFPDCSLDYSGDEWKRGIKFIDRAHQEDMLEVMMHSIDEQKNSAGKPWIDMPRLSSSQMASIANILSPNINPDIIRDTLNFGVKQVDQIEEIQRSIFDGLSENKKLMIQGPPGSGKSSAAKQFMIRQDRNGKKGLYICWNLLLHADVKSWVDSKQLNAEVWVYFELVKELLSLAELDPASLTFHNYREEICDFLKESFRSLSASGKIPQYDYLIVDESQDLFHLGIDIVIENLLCKGQGLNRGSYWLLYDTLQGYNNSDPETIELIKMYSAHFRLKNRFRAAGNPGILKLITDIDTGIYSPEKNYGASVSTSIFNDEKEALKHIKTTWNTQRVKGNYNACESVLLFSSDLLDPENKKGRAYDHMTEKSEFAQVINRENLDQLDPNKIPFTTILRFKGLERNVVFLVLRDPQNARENKGMYQFFMGASRATSKLHVLLLNHP